MTYDPEIAHLAREAIKRNGGLVGQADIARRFGVGRTTVNQWTAIWGFPKPVCRVATKTDIWLRDEIDAWAFVRLGRTPQTPPRGGEEE